MELNGSGRGVSSGGRVEGVPARYIDLADVRRKRNGDGRGVSAYMSEVLDEGGCGSGTWLRMEQWTSSEYTMIAVRVMGESAVQCGDWSV